MGPEGGCAVSHVFLNAWGFESPDFVKWAMCISQTAVFGVSGPSFRKSNFSVLNSPIFSFRRKNTALSCGVFAVYLFCQHILEVTPRFELGNEGFADPCLTTWLCHHIRETAFSGRFSVWSGRRGSNSLPRPWQGRALPDELRPRMAPVFQHHGASGRSRTNDTRIFSPLLYQLSYRGKWRPRWGSNPRPPA